MQPSDKKIVNINESIMRDPSGIVELRLTDDSGANPSQIFTLSPRNLQQVVILLNDTLDIIQAERSDNSLTARTFKNYTALS